MSNVISSSLNVETWSTELQGDPDREFLLHGIREGFSLIDPDISFDTIADVEENNYRSATSKTNKPIIEKQLINEILEGNYKFVKHKPKIVSALGSVPKPQSSDLRIIHDCSRPVGASLNTYASLDKERYQSVDEAVKLSKKNCFYAKVDLKSAYRSVKIHPSNFDLTGIKWQFDGEEDPSYLVDTKLPFGARKSPAIFHRLTQSVRRMMAGRGFKSVVVYLDDFLVIGDTREECFTAYNTLISLLRDLGFYINWKKVIDPTQRIIFLGICLNSLTCQLELPQDKCDDLMHELNKFLDKKRATKKQLQSLAGKLNWACQAIRGGRTFLRRILDAQNCLKQAYHKLKLTSEFYADILWWKKCMLILNGKNMFINDVVADRVEVDACNMGAGMSFRSDWAYLNWELDWEGTKSLHINFKETLAIIGAAKRWGPLWRNKVVFIHTDNQCAKQIINKGTTKNSFVMSQIRELFMLDFLVDTPAQNNSLY